MAAQESTAATLIVSASASLNSNATLIAIANTQIPLKLTPMNYPTWSAQFDSLLIGYDLIGYIDGSHPCPSDNTATTSFWKRQDQLLLHAIRISVSDSIATLIASTKSSKEAWDKLKGLYAN